VKQGSKIPLLIVISAPSGAGKTTLCDRLRRARPDIVYSVSCTTRKPRAGERNGTHYFFLSEKEFRARVSAGEFLETAEVHGHLYGTLRETVRRAMDEGRNVLMDIDVQGAAQIRSKLSDMGRDNPLRLGFVDIFILPPSMEALRQRLMKRGKDSAEVIATRLANAELEMKRSVEYGRRVVNDDLDRALSELLRIVAEEESGGNAAD
jgi:guanylate kinase